ncbi:MAG: hypothetical protein H7Y04_02795, partial [Verrucomicrobia bacterium]|nr:hypothetical protein [Cytophagales bacterium]
MSKIISSFLLVFIALCTAFAQYSQIYSFPPVTNYPGFEIGYATELNGKLLFLNGRENSSKTQLWISDLTRPGTFAITDTLNNLRGFTKRNNQLFFFTFDYNAGSVSGKYSLWKTDGTRPGTRLIKKDVSYVAFNPFTTSIELVDMEEKLYFFGYTQDNNVQLWQSDGSETGTFPLVSLSVDQNPADLVSTGSQLFFTTHTSDRKQYTLWRSDGSNTGTLLVKTFEMGSVYDNILLKSWGYTYAGALNNVLYFSGYDAGNGKEFWRSDGTPGGTYLLKNIAEGTYRDGNGRDIPLNVEIKNFFTLGNQLFFTEGRDIHNLWKTDGTAEGTVMVKNTAQNNSPYYTSINSLYKFEDTFVFVSRDNKTGAEPWISDGTAAGTFLLKNIRPGSQSSLQDTRFLERDIFFTYKREVYFFANDGICGKELWKTDGTPQNTRLLADLTPGLGWTFSEMINQSYALVGSKLAFFNKDRQNNWQLNALELNGSFPVSNPLPPFWQNSGEWYQTVGTEYSPSYLHQTVGRGLTTDTKNNVYLSVSGNSLFAGLSFFDNDFRQPTQAPNTTFYSIFLSKFEPSGKLAWAKHIPGSNNQTAFDTDLDNNVYVSGGFYQKAALDSVQISSPGHAMYFAKYNENGKLLFYKTFDNRV